MLINIRRGLHLVMDGQPEQIVHSGADPESVAVVGLDYPSIRPTLRVQEGDRVGKGQTLFADRAAPSVCVTAPASGRVREINRGPRRGVVSVVIEREAGPTRRFASHSDGELSALDGGEIRQTLQTSGLWPAFRTRPLGRTPAPDATPVEIFVTAIDTDPLAPNPALVIAESAGEFAAGLKVLSAFVEKTLYLCSAPEANLPGANIDKLVSAQFHGPHPAGLPGTHMYFLNSNQARRSERWQVDYQDVMAIGHVFSRGELPDEQIIALAGSGVRQPRLLRVTPGCDLTTVLGGEVRDGCRVIAGSVLSGRQTNPATHYLGRSQHQVSVLAEPAMGETRTGMLAAECLERVWPFRVPLLPLLRALLVRDAEMAIALGCLDLVTEDLALCTYVCPARLDYGQALRDTIAEIERHA